MSGQASEQLTLFQEVSLASLFPWLESKKEKKTTVTYGRKCSELSENLRRVGLSVRMYLESCALPGEQFVRTWSVRDTLSPYLILKLRLSERRTDGNGCSLWVGTPQAANANHNVRSEKFQSKTLNPVEFAQMWPTPCASEARQGLQIRREGKKGNQQSLSTAVRLWATPNAADCQGTTGGGQSRSLRTDVKMFPTPRAQSATSASNAPNRQGAPDLQTVAGGQLNPTWVEWLMGFPLGWTDLNVSETP